MSVCSPNDSSIFKLFQTNAYALLWLFLFSTQLRYVFLLCGLRIRGQNQFSTFRKNIRIIFRLNFSLSVYISDPNVYKTNSSTGYSNTLLRHIILYWHFLRSFLPIICNQSLTIWIKFPDPKGHSWKSRFHQFCKKQWVWRAQRLSGQIPCSLIMKMSDFTSSKNISTRLIFETPPTLRYMSCCWVTIKIIWLHKIRSNTLKITPYYRGWNNHSLDKDNIQSTKGPEHCLHFYRANYVHKYK